MNRKTLFATIVSFTMCFVFQSLSAYYPNDFQTTISVITFGSCNQHDLPQDFWKTISGNDPDLWIWGGDNVYGDSLDEKVILHKYTAQFWNPAYRIFRESTPIIGTWDDHDFGENNSGKWYTGKVMTQRLALDFLEEPKDSPRRQQKGIYTSYVFGPPEKQVKIILIDNRYHADRIGPEAELLGEEQKLWLRKELRTSKAKINFIVSGTQVLPEEQRFEKWNNFPKTRTWLLRLIKRQKIPGVVFLSGDRHIHEISKKDDNQTLYPLIDMTSSGLTHYYEEFSGEPNKYRVGDVYAGLGFGLVKIDWDAEDPEITFQIRNMQNEVMEELPIQLGEITP